MSHTIIKVIAPGATVRIGQMVKGMVTQISLRGDGTTVLYEVAWWDGNTRNCQWLHDFEVVQAAEDTTEQITIGFAIRK